MKRIVLLLSVIFLILSCKKDDEPAVFDFNVSGIEKIEAMVEQSYTVHLLVTGNDLSPEIVTLRLEDVPEGITYRLNNEAGLPEFAASLEITVSRNAPGGMHTLRLVASSSTLVKEFPLKVNIDRSISASFTVYNSSGFDPNDYNSNLLDSAIIKLYKSETSFVAGIPDYTAYTRNSGKAFFYKLPAGIYLFTVEKGKASNIVKKKLVNGVMKGYIVAGVFRSMQEVINSAQPNARSGDLKYRDLNSDNKITDADLGQYDTMSIYDGQVNEKVIWIGI